MARPGNLSIIEQEKKKARAKERKKLKQQRSEQNLERLKRANPNSIRRRIEELTTKRQRQNGRLIINEERLLEKLTKDLETIEDKGLDTTTKSAIEHRKKDVRDDQAKKNELKLYSKSVFYHPAWNPFGVAPDGFENIEISKVTKQDDVDERGLDIPLPADAKPKYYKIDSKFQTATKEVAPALKLSNIEEKAIKSKQFIPSVLKRK